MSELVTPHKDLIAPKKHYRVVEIDIRVATGFYDDDSNGEHCVTVIGDYRFRWWATHVVARRRPGGRYHRQVHDDRGTCIAYYS